MAIFFYFPFFEDQPLESQGHSVPELQGREIKGLFFLLSGLVKHEAYWQMLKFDISCPDISFQFVSTFNDSGGFYFLKGTQSSFLKYDGWTTCIKIMWGLWKLHIPKLTLDLLDGEGI